MRFLFTLAFVAFATLILWWESSGYPTEGQICNPPAGTENCQSHNILFALAVVALDKLNYYGVLVTAIATSFIAWYTFELKAATSKLSEADRPHMFMSELVASGITNRPDQNGKVILDIEFKFKNLGRNPAFLSEYILMFDIRREWEEEPDYGVPTNLRFVVAVNGLYGSILPFHIPIDATNIAEILLGRADLFIYGYLKYSGISAAQHRVRFAYRMIFTSGGDKSDGFYPDGPDTYWEYN